MRKQTLYTCVAALLLLTGCEDFNDKHFEGLDGLVDPIDIKNLDYTLADADYAAISDNKTNQAIAKEAGLDKDLGYVKNDLFLNGKITPVIYIPAFLAEKFFTAESGSVVRVTYKYKDHMSELLSAYTSVNMLKAENEAYQEVYGNTESAPYLDGNTQNEVEYLIAIGYELAGNIPKKGEVVFLDYHVSTGTENVLRNPFLWENFESLATGELTILEDWMNGGKWFVSSKGETTWTVTAYNNNQYVQYTAARTPGECVGWLISPAITVRNGDKMSFDVNVGNWNADCLSVWISEKFDGTHVEADGVWTEITSEFSIPKAPEKGYGNFASAGVYDLMVYQGKKINIAFKYAGDGTSRKTTAYQLDNVMIGSEIPEGGGWHWKPAYTLRVFDGNRWNKQDSKVHVLSYEDYMAMGQSKAYFNEDVPAVNYLSAYLAKQVAYPQDKEARVVAYRYYNGKQVKIYSDEYRYSAETAHWALNTRVVEQTGQFVLKEGSWRFDPSLDIVLNNSKSDKETAAFYQVITDWVKENKGGEYVTSFGNNDYYYGGSAYQNYFDFNPVSWKGQNAEAYGSMSDEDLKALMYGRLPEAFVPGLEAMYPDVEPVEGVKVIYAIKFYIHDGSSTKVWTIQYEVTAKGEFTYIEDSLKAE